MSDWRSDMRREMEHLQRVLDGLGDAIDVRLSALQVEMRHEFDEQKRLSLEQSRINEEQRRINEEQGRVNQDHHRSVSRLSATFDQSIADLHDDLLRRIRTGSLIWSGLTERTAEMRLDLERVESQTEQLRRRVDAIEKRLAG